MKTLPKKDERNWSKIGIIVLGIGFAVLFVGSYVLSILTGSVFVPAVKPGDSVAIDLTIRDSLGRPIITSNQPLYSSTMNKGDLVFFIQPLTISANRTFDTNIIGIDGYFSGSGSWITFGIMRPELELISSEIVGMRAKDTKMIDLSNQMSAPSLFNKEVFEQIIGNYSQATVGKQYPIAFADQPSVDLDPSNPSERYYRIAQVIDKSEENITLSYLYSSAEVTILSTVTG
jgi:hypothetical protein